MPETALLKEALYLAHADILKKNNECSRKGEELSSVFAKLDLASFTKISKIVDNEVPMLFIHMSRRLCAQFPAGTKVQNKNF